MNIEPMEREALEKFWTARYLDNKTGWDIGYPSTPIKEYIDQLENKELRILIPGAGNAYEAEYLYNHGFQNVYVLDISQEPLRAFKKRVPSFPDEQMIQGDFFNLKGSYDIIFEQTFFCSFEPTTSNRQRYAEQLNQLLKQNGKLVGLWFDIPLVDNGKRPFGGTKEEYLSYLSPYFEVKVFESCTNSIKPRMGTELFGIFLWK